MTISLEEPTLRHFTVSALAKRWSVSKNHIYGLIGRNEIRHLRIGTAIRIPAIFVKEYEEAACQHEMVNKDCCIASKENSHFGDREKVCKRDAYRLGQKIAAQQNRMKSGDY